MPKVQNLVIEHHYWSAHEQASELLRPPYPSAMNTTPISQYHENTWCFPSDWLPAGSRNRRHLLFLEPAIVQDMRISLNPANDGLLLDQLKQVVCYTIFHQQNFSKKLSIATIHGRFSSLKKIFVATKSAGMDSIGQINAYTFPKLRALLPENFNESLLLALKILISACKNGFVLDPITDFSIEVVDTPRTFDSSAVTGQHVMSDEQYSALSRKVQIIIENYEEYRNIIIDTWTNPANAEIARGWLLPHFPGVAALRIDGIRRVAPRLLQTASAIMTTLAVGMRPNELLSIQRGLLTQVVELPPKDRTCSGLRLRVDELARGLIS